MQRLICEASFWCRVIFVWITANPMSILRYERHIIKTNGSTANVEKYQCGCYFLSRLALWLLMVIRKTWIKARDTCVLNLLYVPPPRPVFQKLSNMALGNYANDVHVRTSSEGNCKSVCMKISRSWRLSVLCTSAAHFGGVEEGVRGGHSNGPSQYSAHCLSHDSQTKASRFLSVQGLENQHKRSALCFLPR